MEVTRLKEMLEQVHSSAFGWALHCSRGHREEALDLLQSVYLSVLEGKARFEGRSTFKTWLFAVIRRTAQKRRGLAYRLYRMAAGLPVRPSAHDAALDLKIYRGELRSRILQLLDRLSPRQRQILHLVFYQGFTVEQAAEVMGISLGSARTHYERGKARIYEQICLSGIENEYTSGRLENQAAL